MQRYLRATVKLVLHVLKFTTLPEKDFEEAFDDILDLLERANNERYRLGSRKEAN